MDLLKTRSYTLLGPLRTLFTNCQLATHLESPPFRTMVTLLDLPNELLVTIFSSMPARSILACGASCRRLHAVIKESKLLEWRIWSTEHGIQELPPLGLSLRDLFANVKEWQEDWLSFRVGDEVATRFMHRPPHGSPELFRSTKDDFLMRSGYLIQMHQKGNPGWSHMHLSPLRELRGFINDPVWTDVRLGDHLTMQGWALDLDQDLVAASFLS
jgi:hypothetical protein